MERRIGLAALDVEKYSKIGTQDLQTGQLDQALEAFKYAYKRSHELEDGFTERACAFNLGAAYIAMGQPKRGLEILHKAVPPENRREGKSNGDLYFNFGLGYEGLGNYEDAARNYTKALEEYRAEGDNSEMEIETLEKLAQIYARTKNAFTVDAYSQLVQLYENTNNPANYLKHMRALFEKSNHLYQGGTKAEAEISADECMKITEKCGANTDVGNILNDLGLVYTQLQKYDRALICFEQALPMIRSKQVDRKQKAVLLKNLGVTFNCMGDYQRAIGFHDSAIKLNAKLKNRKVQGQCFANLAFAFSQLKDPESAGEAFLHAYQAAKDTGDRKTQWQVTEGLGAVAFYKGQVNEAVAYFQQALIILSTCDPNTIAQDRIVSKLTHALQVQVSIQTGQKQKTHVFASEESSSEEETGSSTESEDSEESDIEHKKEELIRSIKHDSGVKGKIKNKIKEESEEEEESESTSDEDGETEDGETDEEQEVREKEDSEEDDMEKKAVKQEMFKIYQAGVQAEEAERKAEEAESEESGDEDKNTAAKRPLSPKVNVEQASKKDSDSESDSELGPPAPPTQSPMPTAALVRTYDDPVSGQMGLEAKNRRTKYADIEFQSPVGTSGMKSDVRNTDPNLHDHPNYFDSESEEDVKFSMENGEDKQITNLGYSVNKNMTDENLAPSLEQDDNDPVYQSIKTGDRTLIQTEDGLPQDDQQQLDFSTFANLPRGENDHESRAEQERRLFEEHQKYRQRQSEAPPSLPERRMDQKPSKTCVVM